LVRSLVNAHRDRVRYPAAVAILMGAALKVKRLDGGRRSAPAAPPTASKPKMNPPTWAKNATPDRPGTEQPPSFATMS
jgi:hypothetical protein